MVRELMRAVEAEGGRFWLCWDVFPVVALQITGSISPALRNRVQDCLVEIIEQVYEDEAFEGRCLADVLDPFEVKEINAYRQSWRGGCVSGPK